MTYTILKKIGEMPGNNGGGVLFKFKKVTTIAHLFPKMNFLYTQYGLKPDDIISVRHSTRKDFKWFRNYRTPWRHFHNGTVADFLIKAKKRCDERGNMRRQK